MKNIDFKNIDIIYHISDKDLDGYGSQLMTKEFTKNFENKDKNKIKIKYFNPQREEILGVINNVFSEIVLNKKLNYLILITDISLEIDQVKKINNFKKGNKNINIEYQLLDHHISGIDFINNEWYHLDQKHCSARLTYKFYEKNFSFNEKMNKVSELIEVKDLWIKEDKNFNKSTFYSDKIMEIKYPDMFKEHERTEKLYMIKFLGNLLLSNISLQICEFEYIKLKNDFYNFHLDKSLIKNEDLSSDLRKNYYYYSLFKSIKNNFKNINIEKYKMKIIYGMEPHIFQVLSSLYLEENNEIQIMLNINNNGKLSLRCNQDIKDINLSEISNKYFGGGGHPKAAGGKINLIEKIYSQKGIEKIISDLIKDKNIIESEPSL